MARVVSFIFVLSLLAFIHPALCDAPDSGAEWNRPRKTGSDAGFDKRLPPVLPGEEIGPKGDSMKVWTTTGPVPVSEAPEPFAVKTPAANLGGVIVDTRRGRQ